MISGACEGEGFACHLKSIDCFRCDCMHSTIRSSCRAHKNKACRCRYWKSAATGIFELQWLLVHTTYHVLHGPNKAVAARTLITHVALQHAQQQPMTESGWA
eukprot:1158802-Pelagomonas_calceolata.AAC.4